MGDDQEYCKERSTKTIMKDPDLDIESPLIKTILARWDQILPKFQDQDPSLKDQYERLKLMYVKEVLENQKLSEVLKKNPIKPSKMVQIIQELQQEGYPLKILLRAGNMSRRKYYRYLKSNKELLEGRKPVVERSGRGKSTHCQKIDGTLISNESVLEIIGRIGSDEEPNQVAPHDKCVGDKRLSQYLLDTYGIHCNHKKLYRLRKEAGMIRDYRKQ